ncbi:MAG TPA: N,N-dimethylformamidase beta subunit family domain-containing protein [Ktedonobacterales bacterium]|nr:N,N-dimethylformamidase beta subunit family domain-containing protein [Ktedonobacterales bacterium]
MAQRAASRPRPLRPGARAWLVTLLLLVATASVTGGGYFVYLRRLPELSHRSAPGDLRRAPRNPHSAALAAENARPGTRDWLVSLDIASPDEIQAYASAPSVAPGGTLTFYVSVQHASLPVAVSIYRLGWYGGTGGRLMTSFQRPLHAQGYYDGATRQLVGCATCTLDPSTHLLAANWAPAFTLPIPKNWVSGIYEAKLQDGYGARTYVLFDVTGRADSAYLVVTPDATVQAYNSWGGYSLYHGPDGQVADRARKVSLDRPLGHEGYDAALFFEIATVRWLEHMRYDVTYTSDIDLHEHPAQLLNHASYLSIGHDEYWSRQMRDAVISARDHGVGLGFFGANAVHWQIRLEPDARGIRDRTIVCYRQADEDPLYGIDDAHVTVEWRDPLLNQPENAVMGVMFVGLLENDVNFPWTYQPSAPSPFVAHTGLVAGKKYGCDVVGQEWDGVVDNGRTPPGLVVLGATPAVGATGQTSVGNTTYYYAHSGALVFASGSLYWAFALDNLRLLNDPRCSSAAQVAPIPELQTLTANLMDGLAGWRNPLPSP